MDIGGACASGGPFVPVRPCPEGVPILMMLGVLGLFGFGGLGFYAGARVGGAWVALPLLAWPGLFLSLGWNFLEYGFWPPFEQGWAWAWLFCGIIFVLMGAHPAVSSACVGSMRSARANNVVPRRYGVPLVPGVPGARSVSIVLGEPEEPADAGRRRGRSRDPGRVRRPAGASCRPPTARRPDQRGVRASEGGAARPGWMIAETSS